MKKYTTIALGEDTSDKLSILRIKLKLKTMEDLLIELMKRADLEEKSK